MKHPLKVFICLEWGQAVVSAIEVGMDDDPNDRKALQRVGVLITIPFVLALPPMIGWWVGHWIDNQFNLTPYGAYGLLFLGFFAGARECYRLVKKYGANV